MSPTTKKVLDEVQIILAALLFALSFGALEIAPVDVIVTPAP